MLERADPAPADGWSASPGDWAAYDDVDLTGVTGFEARVASPGPAGGFEIRVDSPTVATVYATVYTVASAGPVSRS